MRILIVEDEHLIANSIKKGLEQERYAVDVAYDGGTGFDLAATEEYDLIILDLLLPEIDGLTICKKLREKRIDTPILMLTAKGQTADKIAGLDAGADDYLTKPFSFEELLARIRALTRRPKNWVGATLKVDDLLLNEKLFEVERAGKKIKLSSKEFALLAFLMKNANKILTKEQITNHVWDYSADILPNTIEVYIRNLRKKVDAPFKKLSPLIKTARGFGYLLGNNYV